MRGRTDGRQENHRLPTAGSGSGRCGTSDGQVPRCPCEACRRCRQEQHRPPDSLRCEGTPHERNGAKADQDDASGNAQAREATEMAVLPWRDYALHAGTRGRSPPPAQPPRSGAVIRCVHRDASCQLWCRPPTIYQYDITLIDEPQVPAACPWPGADDPGVAPRPPPRGSSRRARPNPCPEEGAAVLLPCRLQFRPIHLTQLA